MFASLAFVFLFGLMGAAVFEKMKLPRIIGMLLAGILIGPYALGLLDPTILSISGDLRKLALMLILLRAGLSLDLGDLKRVGRPAVLMAFVPATFEVLAVVLFAPMILGVPRGAISVCPLAFGEVGVKELVRRVLDKKPTKVLIALALVIRSVGVCLCVAGTKLTKKERLFCVIAYLPKATVQAAIGATPLAMGLPCGNLVLSVAVLAILLTAPLGAIGMDATADRLLQK